MIAEADIEEDATEESERRYRAPALEKGLDVLELLAREPGGLSLNAIVQRLGRSQGELFRMVHVLVFRGYIAQSSDGTYQLTDRLFALGMEQPPTRGLVELALPVMRRLARTLGQSCHLAFHSAGDIVVVARMESGEQIGFSVRIGYRRSLVETASGVVLFAHQPEDVQRSWRALMQPRPSGAAMRAFLNQCEVARDKGHVRFASPFVESVVDLSAPVMRGDVAAAALTMPFLIIRQSSVGIEQATGELVAAAAELSGQLASADNRA